MAWHIFAGARWLVSYPVRLFYLFFCACGLAASIRFRRLLPLRRGIPAISMLSPCCYFCSFYFSQVWLCTADLHQLDKRPARSLGFSLLFQEIRGFARWTRVLDVQRNRKGKKSGESRVPHLAKAWEQVGPNLSRIHRFYMLLALALGLSFVTDV